MQSGVQYDVVSEFLDLVAQSDINDLRELRKISTFVADDPTTDKVLKLRFTFIIDAVGEMKWGKHWKVAIPHRKDIEQIEAISEFLRTISQWDAEELRELREQCSGSDPESENMTTVIEAVAELRWGEDWRERLSPYNDGRASSYGTVLYV